MISYKYNIYKSKNTKHLDKMLRECAFVWNHALNLQKTLLQEIWKIYFTEQASKALCQTNQKNPFAFPDRTGNPWTS